MRITRVALALSAAAIAVVLSACGSDPTGQDAAKNTAQDSQAVVDLSAARTATASILTLKPGTTPTVADLSQYGYTASGNTTNLAVHGSDPSKFCIDATAKSGDVLKATNTQMGVAGACVAGTDY